MKKRRVDRKVLQEKRRQKRQYPFTEHTRLRDFVEKESFADLAEMLSNLRPYLKEGEEELCVLNRLYFDSEKIVGCKEYVYAQLALFLKKAKDAGTLKYLQSVFFRYLSTPEHCNLGITENSLKALISEAMRRFC